MLKKDVELLNIEKKKERVRKVFIQHLRVRRCQTNTAVFIYRCNQAFKNAV
jgi:DNA primase